LESLSIRFQFDRPDLLCSVSKADRSKPHKTMIFIWFCRIDWRRDEFRQAADPKNLDAHLPVIAFCWLG